MALPDGDEPGSRRAADEFAALPPRRARTSGRTGEPDAGQSAVRTTGRRTARTRAHRNFAFEADTRAGVADGKQRLHMQRDRRGAGVQTRLFVRPDFESAGAV